MNEFSEHPYIRRRGRLTQGQARALEHDAQHYVVTLEDLSKVGWTAHPVGVEIGFGMGETLLEWAVGAPQWQLFGIELYQPGIGAMCAALRREDINNVRIIEQPAQLALRGFPQAGVQQVNIYFPDPWPKKRHNRRRLIQPEFVTQLAEVIADGGELRLATDWQPYAEWMRQCMSANAAFECTQDTVRPPASGHIPAYRQSTKFERRGERLGHNICDLVFCRRSRRAT